MQRTFLAVTFVLSACVHEPIDNTAEVELDWIVKKNGWSASCGSVGAVAVRATYESDAAELSEYYDCDWKGATSQALALGDYSVQLDLEDEVGKPLDKRVMTLSLGESGATVRLPEVEFEFDYAKYEVRVRFYHPDAPETGLECDNCQVELRAENLSSAETYIQRFDCESLRSGGYKFLIGGLPLASYRVSVSRLLGPELWPISWIPPEPVVGDPLAKAEDIVRLPTLYLALPDGEPE